ncbi:DNA-directed RNA polymerase I subunit RPA2-like isoform 6-T11 [Glossina fuscipes fuscipes]
MAWMLPVTILELDNITMLLLPTVYCSLGDYNQSPRNMCQCRMAKQTDGYTVLELA